VINHVAKTHEKRGKQSVAFVCHTDENANS